MARWAAALLLSLPALGQDSAADLGLKVASGFKVTLYADHEIANDIYAMTLDAQGRVVVTSQGWIKTLHDSDGDGRADRATLFAETRTGGMGLCFDGNDLYFSGDGGFFRFRDADGDGKADGPPERLGRFSSGEHGHHAMRKGPDGFWYLIGGNDAGIRKEHITMERSAVRDPETGAILRYTPDAAKAEIIAHGFRNPYDFDFTPSGDILTYDSDCERDYFLPWYTPTRIYHVGYGLHHGWRLKGYQRSFARLDYYPDNVNILWPIGRGSPTGVACYRHTKFPARYRGGVFALDWTFGRVWFLPLQPQGASFTTKAEVFLEPIGTHGFAPTDIAVAPDGSLFISIGGRRTRGGVYKVEFTGAAAPPAPVSPLEEVLHAPQPLDAWSRARWEPLARKLGKEPFLKVLADEKYDEPARVRAVEVLTELFGGVPAGAAKSSSARVRARLAWSLGRAPTEGFSAPLLEFARDPDPAVRRAALESLGDRAAEVQPPDRLNRRLLLNFEHPDKRVRAAAARAAALLPAAGWNALLLDKPRVQVLLSWTLAAIWRGEPAERTLESALFALEGDRQPAHDIDAMRLLVLALGDCNLNKPPIEVHSNYSLPSPVPEAAAARILKAVRAHFPSGQPRLDAEASRILAMLEDDDAETVPKVAPFLTDASSAASDVHYLVVLSRLRGAWPEELAPKAAHALLSLSRKLEGQEQRTKQVWGARLAELTTLLVKRHPAFADELLKHPAFVAPGHVDIAAALEGARRLEAARKFLEAARADEKFPWSEQLIALLGRLPPEEFHPVLRAQWSNFGLRDSIVMVLADRPAPLDREKFLAGVESGNPQAVKESLEALEKLPRDDAPRNLVPLLRLLRRLVVEAKQGQAPVRKQVLALVSRQWGKAFDVKDEGADPVALKQAYQSVFDAFAAAHADLKGELAGDGEDPAALKALLGTVPWEKGDARRGEELFRARGCQTCHAVQGALGPNLAGAASRFSREDLFEAIANPNRDVAPLYRTIVFQLKDGQVHSGIIAFESADGYIVQTGATTTVRIATADVAAMRPGANSLMPNGLLAGLKPGDLADLYAYLRGLGK